MTQPTVMGLDVIEYRPVSFTLTAGSKQLFGSECLVGGWSVHETTGAAVADATLYDGTDVGGQPIGFPHCDGGKTDTQTCPHPGVHARNALFVNVSAGSMTGTVWIATKQ